MPQATDSQIAMWRGMIALAWADRGVDDGEKTRLLEYFRNNIYLSDSQRAQLAKDMDQPIELKDVWGSITDTQDRAHLIDIAPSLFATHGSPTPKERAVYEKMCADQMATVDTKKLESEFDKIKAEIPVEQAEEDAEYKSEFHHWGPLDKVVYHIDKTINDVFGLDPAEG